MTSPFLPYWLASLYLPKVGPRTLMRWIEAVGNIEKLFLANTETWRSIGCTGEQMQALASPNWRQVEQDLAWGKEAHHHLIAWDDERYPPLLKEIANPPHHLFVMGRVEILKKSQMAIVGARSASHAGLHHAEQFASYLARAGLVITSGMARGIDGAAHRGALQVAGETIGVAGTGLYKVYPPSHRPLMTAIIEGGGTIVSEFPLNTPPRAMNFPYRNRIISGLSLGVLVVEAALKSGSLVTAKHALEQNREVFAIPQSIHQPLARGCHYLIREGAKLVETVHDILGELKGYQDASLSPLALIQAKPTVPTPYRIIFDQISDAVTSIDTIIARSGLTSHEVSSMLLKLELDGYIQAVTGGYVRKYTT